MKINDEGTSNAAYWHERAMKAEARLQKIMARCADLLDEDQFNELDAIARAAVSASEDIVREQRLAEAEALRETRAKELSYVVEACTAALVIRTTHESRDALRDLRAWATNRIDAHLARKDAWR